MSITVKDLSADQLQAYNAIVKWVRDADSRPVMTLGGYAGSGKSTLVSLIAEQVELPAFCAYTGKATSILRRKLHSGGTQTVGAQPRRDGMPSLEPRPYCGTIHSLIYRPCECREPKTVELSKPCPQKDCVSETRWENGRSVCGSNHVGLVPTQQAFNALAKKTKFSYAKRDENGRCTLCHGKEWLRRDVLDREYGLIIVDEASMVDDMMIRDLQSYGVPILAVGDHGQLPPVGGSGSLMRDPHLRLERIHRQAEGNPIIALSKIIRETGELPDCAGDNDAVTFGRLRFLESILESRYADASDARLLEMGAACYTNRRRVALNLAVRRARGVARTGRELPRSGEHVVCLRNMKGEQGRPPIANGMRGVLTNDVTWKQNVNYRGERLGESETQIVGHISFPEDDIAEHEYVMLANQFGREKTYSSPEELAKETGVHSFAAAGSLFDFGYVMTTHKCVDPDTLVETTAGLVRAGALAPEGQIATPSGRAAYCNFVRNPVGPMLSVTTVDGYELRVTPDHGVDVWGPDGYERREARTIKPGDTLRLRLGAEFRGQTPVSLPAARPQDVRARAYDLPEKCTHGVAEFLGLMVADGTVWRGGFRLAKRHEDVADRFDSLCRELFGATPSRFFKLNAHHVEVASTLIADWLRDVGGMQPNAKMIPDCIFSSPLEVQASFLRGLFEDGTVNVRAGDILDHIEFTSAMPGVRRAVRTMLLRFGIVSGATPSRPSVYIYGQYAKLFGDKIGFVSSFKQKRLNDARVPEGTRYTFPLRADERHLARGEIQRHRAPAELFADRAPFHHSKVTHVLSYAGESVCVEVPDGHQFLQDGFCGWNCQGSQFDDFLVCAERPGPVSSDDWRRWLYTAVTRAAKKLTVLK